MKLKSYVVDNDLKTAKAKEELLDTMMTNFSSTPILVALISACKTVFNTARAKPITPFDQMLTPEENALIDNNRLKFLRDNEELLTRLNNPKMVEEDARKKGLSRKEFVAEMQQYLFKQKHTLLQILEVRVEDLPKVVTSILTNRMFFDKDKRRLKKEVLALEQAARIVLLNRYRNDKEFVVTKPIHALKLSDVQPEHDILVRKLGLPG
jgi:ribosome recycling factor